MLNWSSQKEGKQNPGDTGITRATTLGREALRWAQGELRNLHSIKDAKGTRRMGKEGVTGHVKKRVVAHEKKHLETSCIPPSLWCTGDWSKKR